ncbi:unnamed protein product (macronuclear) [Paramecium tetraurelia]|uniref:Uncharacterized protein n=1 Tax=Paramecium tetraurelia TaxID=5888 RepID=A0BWW7_PARTE|nr:uncharacterized protein GSPATT00032886001 [Paramecium tetraurelia]CAK63034.1 unnamed protein product [Paramecium tetraurelia]|eukprot:XP_001430432.1 hypothetical protein (macronuclear) [Paramecium tetraurelia strain d4-2]
MNQKPLKSIHFRVETHIDLSSKGKISSVESNSQRYGSPNKLPSLQNICRTIQGEDGTVFAMRSLMSRANNVSSNRTSRTKWVLELNERKDLQQLEQWTDLMVQQLQLQQYSNIRDFYEKMELVYTGSITQLGQQLAVKCIDYQTILNKIWSSFTHAVKEIIEKQSETFRKLEKDCLSETVKLHQMYQKTLNDKGTKLQEAERYLKQNSDQNDKMIKEGRYLRKKCQKLEQELLNLRRECDFLKLQNSDLIREIDAMKVFINHQVDPSIYIHQNLVNAQQIEEKFADELQHAKKEMFEDFKHQFEQRTMIYEEMYQRKLDDLERREILNQNQEDEQILQDYQQTIFKDECVGNSITYKTQETDTSDLLHFSDASVQTIQFKKKVYDWSTQTPPVVTFNQSVEANFSMIKRECIPRNKEEQTYLEMSRYPIQVFIDDYHEIKITYNKNTFNQELNDLVDQLAQRSRQLFNILTMKEEFHLDDFQCVSQYVINSYNVFINLIRHLEALIIENKSSLVENKICLYETQIDSKQAYRKQMYAEKKLDMLIGKHQLTLKQVSFLQKQIIRIHKYLPHFQIETIKRQAIKKKIFLEFPKLQSPGPNLLPPEKSNTIFFSSQPQLLIPPQINQSTSSQIQKSALDIAQSESTEPQQLRRDQSVDLSREPRETPPISPMKKHHPVQIFFQDSLAPPDDSSSDDEQEVDIEAQLSPIKNLLSIEKKLFVSKCPSKNTQTATQLLLQEIQQFRRDRIDNIVTRQTLQKYLSSFVCWCVKYGKYNYPLHIQLYEFYQIENFQQPPQVWLQKYQRIIKSIIYYKKKTSYAKLFHWMLIGDQSFNIYLSILNTIQNKEFTENGIFVQQSQLSEAIGQYVKNTIPKYVQLVDYDQEVQPYMQGMQDFRTKEITQKYQLILTLFDQERFTQLQFRLLLLEVDSQRTESQIINLFMNECDLEQNSVQYMSHKRFSQICEEHNLLANLSEYLQKNNAQYFNDLKLWKIREIELKLMLIRSSKYDSTEREGFYRMNELNSNEQRVLLGRFLERRAKELLLEQYAFECLPQYMQIILNSQ